MRTTKSVLTPACNQLARHADMSGFQTRRLQRRNLGMGHYLPLRIIKEAEGPADYHGA
jgi:hypothetical protein